MSALGSSRARLANGQILVLVSAESNCNNQAVGRYLSVSGAPNTYANFVMATWEDGDAPAGVQFRVILVGQGSEYFYLQSMINGKYLYKQDLENTSKLALSSTPPSATASLASSGLVVQQFVFSIRAANDLAKSNPHNANALWNFEAANPSSVNEGDPYLIKCASNATDDAMLSAAESQSYSNCMQFRLLWRKDDNSLAAANTPSQVAAPANRAQKKMTTGVVIGVVAAVLGAVALGIYLRGRYKKPAQKNVEGETSAT